MKRKGALLAAVILIAGGFPAWAHAGGWGPYFSWGRDDPSAGFPDDVIRETLNSGYVPDPLKDVVREAMENAEIDFQIDHITFGVLYDSAPSRDKLFSYRFALGFDISTKVEVEGVSFEDIGVSVSGLTGQLDENGYGLSMNHTFAFALIRNSLLKWWIGPGLRLNFNYYSLDYDIEAANLVIGGGGETGLNFHVTPNLSLCLGGGIHYNAFGYGAGTNDVGSLVWGDGPFYFIQVGALFHTGKDRNAWAASQSVP